MIPADEHLDRAKEEVERLLIARGPAANDPSVAALAAANDYILRAQHAMRIYREEVGG